MSLYVKIGNSEIKLSDIWCDEDAFRELGSEGMKEIAMEDISAFIEEIQLMDHVEFFWRSWRK